VDSKMPSFFPTRDEISFSNNLLPREDNTNKIIQMSYQPK
jgi:hypothetical protein